MQQKYKDQGVVCMTVSSDEPDDGPKALKFLTKIDARLQHFHWTDTSEEMDKRLGSTALPSVLVFGRDGQRAKLFTPENPFSYADVEKVVQELLK